MPLVSTPITREMVELTTEILEETYFEGIQGIPTMSVRVDDDPASDEIEISGQFIGSNGEVFDFLITEEGLAYSPADPPEEDDLEGEEAPELVQDARNCKKGMPCGNSCISRKKSCIKSFSPEQQQKIGRLRGAARKAAIAEAQKEQSGSSGAFSSDPQAYINRAREKYGAQLDRIMNASDPNGELTQRGEAKALLDGLLESGMSEDNAIALISDLNYAIADRRTSRYSQAHLTDAARILNGYGLDSNKSNTEAGTLQTVIQQRDRAYMSPGRQLIDVGTGANRATTMHEYAHFAELSNSEVLAATTAWRNSRATSANPSSLRDITGNRNYRGDEIALEDNFTRAYIGKVYSGENTSTEVFSVGFEFFSSSNNLVQAVQSDREHVELMLGIIDTMQGN